MARTMGHAWFWAIGAMCCACALPACQLLKKDAGLPRGENGRDPRLLSRNDPLGRGGPPLDRTASRPDVDPPSRIAEPASGDIQIRPAHPPRAEVISVEALPMSSSPGPGNGAPVAGNLAPTVVTKPAEKPVPDPPLVAALRCYMDNRPHDALPILQCYDKPNQEMLIGFFAILVRLAGPSLNQASSQELTALLDGLQSLEMPLRPRSQLVLDKMCFCAWSRGFGQFEPLEPGHRFRASLPGRLPEEVRIYVELSNLSSIRRDNLFENRLASSVTIYDGKNKPVWHHDFKDRDSPIRTRTLTRDFSNSYGFSVPHIPPGDYRLRLQVVDVPTGRKADRSLPFHVTTVSSRDF